MYSALKTFFHLIIVSLGGAVSVVEGVVLLILVTVRHGKHGRFSPQLFFVGGRSGLLQ